MFGCGIRIGNKIKQRASVCLNTLEEFTTLLKKKKTLFQKGIYKNKIIAKTKKNIGIWMCICICTSCVIIMQALKKACLLFRLSAFAHSTKRKLSANFFFLYQLQSNCTCI